MGQETDDSRREAVPTDRRDFMKLSATAGLLGVGAFSASSSAAASKADDDADPRKRFPDDAGIIDVTEEPFNAAGDGETDDTEDSTRRTPASRAGAGRRRRSNWRTTPRGTRTPRTDGG